LIPKIYLISRKADLEKVQTALAITPLQAVIVADPRDVNAPEKICEHRTVLSRPIGILADFDAPLTAVNPDGTLTPVEI